MKRNKLYFVLFISLLQLNVYGQFNHFPGRVQTNCDTLKNYAGSDYTLYRISEIDNRNTGYLSGTNSYMDLAKAEKYTSASAKQLTGVNILFAVAKYGSEENTVTINVWSGQQGSPGQVIASQEITISSIKAYEFTFIAFDNPVTINGDFYIGFDIPIGEGDTLAMATCKNGEGKDNTGWEQSADNDWHTYASANMDIQADNIIFPIFCGSGAAVMDVYQQEDIAIYPNPAINVLNIAVAASSVNSIKISIYNLLGEQIISLNKVNCNREIVHLDVSAVKSGLYYIAITNGNKTICKPIMLNN